MSVRDFLAISRDFRRFLKIFWKYLDIFGDFSDTSMEIQKVTESFRDFLSSRDTG